MSRQSASGDWDASELLVRVSDCDLRYGDSNDQTDAASQEAEYNDKQREESRQNRFAEFLNAEFETRCDGLDRIKVLIHQEDQRKHREERKDDAWQDAQKDANRGTD